MSRFDFYDETNAPEPARELLAGAKRQFGMVPNLFAGMAESPPVLAAYTSLYEQVGRTTLTPVEQQVLMLAVSFENGCGYCMAAHSAVAKMTEVPGHAVEALRRGASIDDPKLDALATFARGVVAARGWVGDDEVERFTAAGYSRANVLDVMLVVATKTLSNYVNHVLGTEVDDAFAPFAWERPEPAEGGA